MIHKSIQVILELYAPGMMQNSVYQPNLTCTENEYIRHKFSYMFRHFLNAIIRKSLYQLKLCPSNWSVM